MYEGLTWTDTQPVSLADQMIWGAGDNQGIANPIEADWMDWSLANMDGSQFGYEAASPYRLGGMGGRFGPANSAARIDNDKLVNYLNNNNLSLKSASLGDNTGYRAAFNNETGTMQGSPTFYDINDNFMQSALMLAAPMLAPAAVGGALGLSGGLGSFVGGGALGAGSSLLTGNDPLKGFALGGLGTFMPDVAGYAGIDNPIAKNAVNSGLKGGLSAAIQGGDVGTNALLSGAVGGLNSLGGLFTQGAGEMPDVGTIGGELFADDGISYAGTPGQPGYTPTIASADGRRTAQSENSGEGGSLFDSVSSLLFPTEGKGVFGSNLQFGDLAQGLAGLYSNYRQRRDAKEMLRGISGRRDAYSQNLQRSLQRRDAASGRRSDYGGRDVQLQAALAELDSRNAPAISQLNQQRQQGLAGMLAGALRMGGRAGVLPIGQPNPMSYSLAQGGVPLGPQVAPDTSMYSIAGDPRRRINWGG